MGSGTQAPASDGDVTMTQSDGYFVATDDETGVTSQGETKAEALENLADALRLYRRPVSEMEEPDDPSDAPWF